MKVAEIFSLGGSRGCGCGYECGHYGYSGYYPHYYYRNYYYKGYYGRGYYGRHYY